ncbi:hypothetical protein AB0E77_01920 [Streptomyces sp. NPDC032940]|uniref:hypothetical protein n=1 Tax=Streptomyces sp. NPDC032940 TaxID=3155366 RepID=UPI003405367F
MPKPVTQPPALAGVSVQDLLAACAAAAAVSTPPRAPEPAAEEHRRPVREHREAA